MRLDRFTTCTARVPPYLRSVRHAVLAPLALLAACTSVPLPPWAPSFPRPAVIVPSAPGRGPAAPSAAVQISPVQTPSVIAGVPQDEAEPYSAAVAARFPAPAVVYSTPGLQAGRAAFTTCLQEGTMTATYCKGDPTSCIDAIE